MLWTGLSWLSRKWPWRVRGNPPGAQGINRTSEVDNRAKRQPRKTKMKHTKSSAWNRLNHGLILLCLLLVLSANASAAALVGQGDDAPASSAGTDSSCPLILIATNFTKFPYAFVGINHACIPSVDDVEYIVDYAVDFVVMVVCMPTNICDP